MVPLVRDRPLALQSFPQGTGAPGFFMKSVPRTSRPGSRRVEVGKKGGSNTQVLAQQPATLVYLAGQNVVTPHIWLSRVDEPLPARPADHRPRPVPGIGFAAVRAAAREAGARLRDAGLKPHAMVTGSRGVHVVCPLRRGPAYADVHGYARALAEAMVADDPKRLTLEWHKAERGARIYLDINRIDYAQHAVAPYGVRVRGEARRWRCRSTGTSSRTAR